MLVDFIKSWFYHPKHQNEIQKDKSYKEVLDFEKPKYIYVDGRKTEVDNIVVGHTKFYHCNEKGNSICEHFTTRMWKVKENIPFGISKFCVVDDDGKRYICYLSENRKALIENKLLKENKEFEK